MMLVCCLHSDIISRLLEYYNLWRMQTWREWRLLLFWMGLTYIADVIGAETGCMARLIRIAMLTLAFSIVLIYGGVSSSELWPTRRWPSHTSFASHRLSLYKKCLTHNPWHNYSHRRSLIKLTKCAITSFCKRVQQGIRQGLIGSSLNLQNNIS